jgi:hypothetical protein
MRNRLLSHGSASFKRSSTNLLFALLCLIALEMPIKPLPKTLARPLIKNIKLAVSTYGQILIFFTPIHEDSVTVSLLLANYKPTALVSSQSVAYISINPDIYQYRISNCRTFENVTDTGSCSMRQTTTCNLHNLENFLVQSSQAFQTYCADATLNEFFIKPLMALQQILEPLRPQVELYRSILKSYQCLPSIIFHIQNAIASFIKMDAMTSIKQNWDNLDSVSTIIETSERGPWNLSSSMMNPSQIGLAMRIMTSYRLYSLYWIYDRNGYPFMYAPSELFVPLPPRPDQRYQNSQ